VELFPRRVSMILTIKKLYDETYLIVSI